MYLATGVLGLVVRLDMDGDERIGELALMASSSRSQIWWAAATLMLLGTTRWKSMNIMRPACRVRRSCELDSAIGIGRNDLADASQCLGRDRFVHEPTQRLLH